MRDYLEPREVSLILNISDSQVTKLIEHDVLEHKEGHGVCGDSVSEYILEKKNEEKLLSRRKFLRNTLSFVVPGVAGFIGGTAANFAGSLGASLVHSNLLKDSIEKESNAKNNLASSVFGDLSKASWSTSLDHLLNTYGLSEYRLSSTYLATSSMFSSLLANTQQDIISTSKFPGPVFIDGDIVCIGGPISDPVAKIAFEYEGPRYQQARKKDAVLDLPFTYLPSKSPENGKRFICGEPKEIINFTIASREEILKPPSFDQSGFLKTDYLLISRIPNILSQESYESDKSILVIGGTHGTGTEAIEIILKNKSLLLEISESKKNHEYFQSLFYINDIEHLSINGRKSSIPISALHVETLPIILDNEKITRNFKLEFKKNS